MDFLEAKHAAAREIALAFGVPPMLLGIHGDNTYSNYQEANRVFWRQTVLPLAGRIGCALTQWLAPVFGEGLLLSADIDKIEALSADRTALWERVSKAPFLSVNEKRLAAGYGPIDGGDMFLRQYGVSPACLVFLQGLFAAYRVPAILRAFEPCSDFPELWHPLRTLGREDDVADQARSFENIVVIGRPFAVPALARARQGQRTHASDRTSGRLRRARLTRAPT